MKQYIKQFLTTDPVYTTFDTASIAILPVPYEGAVSYGTGTALAPDSILDASLYLETYDEVLDMEPYRIGITTVEPPALKGGHETMVTSVYTAAKSLLKTGKFTAMIGGDHSITTGYFRALFEHFGPLSVIQLDAHADLRDSYEGNKFSHACTMARIREVTTDTLQLGVRSMSVEEADCVKKENIALYPMHAFRSNTFNLSAALERLPDPVFLTLDVDVFDWSVITSTGTPEPGGMLWDETMALLQTIFTYKRVVGFDIVELSCTKHDRNSSFAVAKMLYKMIGFLVKKALHNGNISLPLTPCGALLSAK